MINVRALIDDVIIERKVEEKWGKHEKIFISYSRKDKDWLERIQVHFKWIRLFRVENGSD